MVEVGDWRTEAAVGPRPRLRRVAAAVVAVGGEWVESCAGSGAVRGAEFGLFGAGHVFPTVSNLR